MHSQLRSRVDRLPYNTAYPSVVLGAYTLNTYNVCINRLANVQPIHYIDPAISHVRNRNENTYQSQDFGSVSTNYCLPDWHRKKNQKNMKKASDYLDFSIVTTIVARTIVPHTQANAIGIVTYA